MLDGGCTKCSQIKIMTDKPNSFWSSLPPLDDLAKIQEYIRPKQPCELPGFFPVGLPPDPSKVKPRQLASSKDGFLDEHGMTLEELIQDILNDPEPVEVDELERLQAVLSGDLPATDVRDILAEHTRVGGRPKVQKVKTAQPLPEKDELDDLFPDRLERPSMPMPGSDLVLSAYPGTIDVGNWWEKRKP